MQSEDKIFGLIAQAEDIQAHAVKLQQVAQEAIKTLPEATRGAVRDAAREIIVEGTEKASRGLLDASSRAIAASEQLRGASAAALIKHVTVLFLVALVISAAIYFGLGFLVKKRAAELEALTVQVEAHRAALDELQSKTWGLELGADATQRWIVLPKGASVTNANASMQDGRKAIIISR